MAFDFEQTVRRQDENDLALDEKKFRYLRNTAYAALGVAVLGIAVTLSGAYGLGLLLLISGSMISLVCWLRKDSMLVEYDYVLEEDTISFSQVLNNSRRKDLATFKLDSIACLARFGDNRLAGYKAQGAKEISCCRNGEGVRWFLYANQTILYFEPSDAIISALRKRVKE